MRLRSLLGMTELGFELLYSAGDLNRPVRWVVTTDMLDPSRYLSGGELVLTGMHWRRGPTDSDAFVRALAGAGIAGLGAGEGRYGEVPADVVAACRRHEVPLFRVPAQVGFWRITEYLTRQLSTGRSAELSAMLERHRGLVVGGGLDALIAMAERDIGMRCWVTSSTGRLLAGTPATAVDMTAPALAARKLPLIVHDGAESYSVFPVDEHGTARAVDWLVIFQGDHSEWPQERHAVARELASVVALERARLTDRLAPAGRLAQKVIEKVVAETESADTIALLEQAGLASTDAYTAVAASCESNALRPAELRLLLCEFLDGRTPVAAVIDGEVIALIAADATVTGDIQRAVTAVAPALDAAGLSIGVSGAVNGASLRGAVEEARYARRLAAAADDPVAIIGHDELATHMLLLASVPDEVRRRFRRQLLDPLHAYDRDNRADLVFTLSMFLETSGAWTKCAELLHLHVNTLRYRIQRIEELTGRDLSKLDDRVDFFLALALR